MRKTAPSFLTSSLRVFDLSVGEMLWSRRTVFMALIVGLPILLAVLVRVLLAFDLLNLVNVRVGGEPMEVAGATLFGFMIWLFFLRFSVPVLGVFYGTALIADEVEDRDYHLSLYAPHPARRGVDGKAPGLPRVHRPGGLALGHGGVLPAGAGRRRQSGCCLPGSGQRPGVTGPRARRLRRGVRPGGSLVQATSAERPDLRFRLGAGHRRASGLHEEIYSRPLLAGLGAARDAQDSGTSVLQSILQVFGPHPRCGAAWSGWW